MMEVGVLCSTAVCAPAAVLLLWLSAGSKGVPG